MKNTKWIAVALVVIIGLGFEGLKKVEPQTKSQIINQMLGDDDYKPFVRAEDDFQESRRIEKDRDQRIRGRIEPTNLAANSRNNLGQQGPSDSMTFENLLKKQEEEENEDGSDENSEGEDEDSVAEDEPCDEEDEECREAIAKKKAEEREKEANKQAKNSNDEEDSSDEDQEANEDVVAAPITGPGGQIGPQGNENLETPEDELITFWVGQLSRAPNRKLANQFAGLRQSKQISGTVYNEVINQLLEDPRESIQIQAAYLLSSYQSADSFSKLVDVAEGAVFGSKLNKTAELYLSNYKKVNNLKHLNRVLGSSTDTLVLKKAIKLVDESAQSNLKGSLDAQGQGSTTLDTKTARFYRGFIDLLEEIAQSVNDSATQSLATRTLAQLEEIIPAEETESNGEVAANI